MKKFLKIFGIVLLLFIVILLAIPFVFKGQIKGMVKDFVNQNVNAHVEFSDVSLSLIKSFPQAHVELSDLVITNLEPFAGETLLSSKSISLSMSVKDLFKRADDAPITINKIGINEALLTLKTDAQGHNNYDITKSKPEATPENDANSKGFTFDIKDYSIKNSAFTYLDEAEHIKFHITELNHTGKGTFSENISELDTHSQANVSISIDSTTYLSNNQIKLDAVIGVDLKNSKYTFKDNEGYINQLPITFKGYVQLIEEGQDMDISFENPGSSFKDFLAVIPKTYSKDISQVETTGNFKVKGIIKGKVTDTSIPKLDISISSNNASFKYPNLPKRVENIVIDTSIKNETGNTDDTYIEINKLNFKIDQDVFMSSATIKNITKNMLVNANIDGTVNLANLSKAYPIDLKSNLSGILKAKLNTSFDMDAIEKNAYDRIKNSGTLSASNFEFKSDEFLHPFQIASANITFNPSVVNLNNFNATTGNSDMKATGTITNLLGFILNNGNLQGHFNVNSNVFNVNDFMMPEAAPQANTKNTASTSKESFKIPSFLDCTINANAATVVYDKMNLKNLQGTLVIKNEQATLSNLTTSLFNGKLAVSGNVSTQAATPTFNLVLGAQDFDISQSFEGFEMVKNLIPIAKALQGKLNASLNLKGDLTNDFSPNLKTLFGDASTEILTAKVEPKNAELLNKLQSNLSFINFDKLNLNDIKTKLEFVNGGVHVKPFNLKYDDINIEISGNQSFDKLMDYNVVFNVPAKYLGSDVNRLIGSIDDKQVNNLTIPISAKILGSFTSPNVSTDLSSGVKNLITQLTEIKKQQLIGKGKDELNNLLGGLIKDKNLGDTKQQDTTKVNHDSIPKPTVAPKEAIKEGVKNVLGGFLNKKKAKDTLQ